MTLLNSISKPFVFFYQNLITQPNFSYSTENKFETLQSVKDYFLLKQCSVNTWINYSQVVKEKITQIFKNNSENLNEQSESLKELDEFLTQVIEIGFQENMEKTLLFITECIEFKYLEAFAKWKKLNINGISYKNIFQWNAIKIPPYQKKINPSLFSFKTAVRKIHPVYLYFLPQLINQFIDFFNLQDQTKYTSRYEKYIMLDLLCKTFVLPQYLAKLFKPYVKTALKAYICAACSICAFGALMAIYQKWLRPMPQELINCKNLDRKRELGLLDNPVGQILEMDKLLEYLGNNKSALVIGSSGIGKSTLMDHLTQEKSRNKLPVNLQKRAIHQFNVGSIISNYQKDQQEQIKETRNQLDGYEDDALLICDEFSRLVKFDHAFNEFKNELLKSKPNILLVCVMTEKEYHEMIKNISWIETFLGCVKPLFMNEPTDIQIKSMLLDMIDEEKQVPVSKDVIPYIVDLSKKSNGLIPLGRSHRAKDLMNTALGRCCKRYDLNYTPPEIKTIGLSLKAMKQEGNQNENITYFKDLETFKTLKNELKKDRKIIMQIQFLYKQLIDLKNNHSKLFFELKNARKENKENEVSEHSKKIYLIYDLFATNILQTLIDEEIAKIQSRMPVQVDKTLIKTIFNESGEYENKF